MVKYSVIFIVPSILLIYVRENKIQRSHIAGQRVIPVNSLHQDVIEFIVRSNEAGHTHSTIKQIIMYNGPCGNSLTNVDP